MKAKTALIFFIVFLFLGSVYYFTKPDYSKTRREVTKTFFDKALVDKVASIKIVRGNDKIKIEVMDNKWVLPDRYFYPADSGKVNSFLLKFFSLVVSQRVTKDKSKYGNFLLSDENIKKGEGVKVSFFDKSKKLLTKVYLGKVKGNKIKPPSNSHVFKISSENMNMGQYVRKGDNSFVYLIDTTLTPSLDIRDWLGQPVLNVINSKVLKVKREILDKEKNVVGGYLLLRERGDENKLSDNDSWVPFPLPFPSYMPQITKEDISLVTSGVKNLRMENVYKKDAKEIKNLEFLVTTSYFMSNGLRYDIFRAKRKGKTFIKLEVELDNDLIKELKEMSKKFNKPIYLSNLKSKEEFNKKHNFWIYEVPEYLAFKF